MENLQFSLQMLAVCVYVRQAAQCHAGHRKPSRITIVAAESVTLDNTVRSVYMLLVCSPILYTCMYH